MEIDFGVWNAVAADGRPYPDPLTLAEQRVLEELRKGGTNGEIAERLGLAPETVQTHVARMLSKLDLDTRRQLTAWQPERPGVRRRVRSLLAPLAFWMPGSTVSQYLGRRCRVAGEVR